jgi:hypothetical protein
MEREKSKKAKSSISGVRADSQPEFEPVRPLLNPPLEITRDMLRLLNMVDENITIHDQTTSPQ